MKRRLKLGFDRLSNKKFLAAVLVIADKLKQPPATVLVPEPWGQVTGTQLKAAVDALAAAYVLAQNKGRDERLQLNARRKELTLLLVTCGLHFESVANQTQDERVLESTGYELTRPGRAEELADVLPPTTIQLWRGNQTGEMFLSARKIERAGGYESQLCLGDPNVEANWKQAAITTGCRRIRFSGLIPGKVYYARLRGIGPNGCGAWSDVANLMAT